MKTSATSFRRLIEFDSQIIWYHKWKHLIYYRISNHRLYPGQQLAVFALRWNNLMFRYLFINIEYNIVNMLYDIIWSIWEWKVNTVVLSVIASQLYHVNHSHRRILITSYTKQILLLFVSCHLFKWSIN